MSLIQQIENALVRVAETVNNKANSQHVHNDSSIASVGWNKLTDIPSDIMYSSAYKDAVNPELFSFSIAGTAAKAEKFTKSKTLTMEGDANWSITFDGSANVTASFTLANSGVADGTYNNSTTAINPFTVDAKGRVTTVGDAVTITPDWTSIQAKPTTLNGYGITDSITSPNSDGKIPSTLVTGLGTAAASDATDFAPASLGNTVSAHSVALGELYSERELLLAVSDESTNLKTGASKITIRAPFAMTLTKIPRSSVKTGSSSGLVVVDIKVAGTSILGANKLSIDVAEKTSVTATKPTTLAATSINDDAEITIDIVSAGTGAKGLKVVLYYKRAS